MTVRDLLGIQEGQIVIIGVVSDTHRNRYMIQTALENILNCDLVIHLGDNVQDVDEIAAKFKGKIINVKGNCDFSVSTASERIEIIEEKKFFITHGHTYNVKYNLNNLKVKAAEIEADVVLYGHTHVSEILFERGIWYINPGSAAFSRKGRNSIAFIDIVNGNINPYIKSL